MFRRIFIIRDTKGLTMIESMIVIAIGLIGVLGSYALLLNVRGTAAASAEVIEAQQEARYIVERIARELRESSPTTVAPDSMLYEDSYQITFDTPRDPNRKFIVGIEGEPEWQRTITYTFDPNSHTASRYQEYGTSNVTEYEVVSENVQHLAFGRTHDMITISIRTFSNKGDKMGSVADSFADLYTMVKLRN
jgi:prepilin-type N-terminal cleavage/methylation domain-containing protein